MPKDFLQGASLKPTFIQHFKCGELHIFHIRFNIVKKHPLQNRTNVQIKGGGVKGVLNKVQKNCVFLSGWHPLFCRSCFCLLLLRVFLTCSRLPTVVHAKMSSIYILVKSTLQQNEEVFGSCWFQSPRYTQQHARQTLVE